MKKFGVQAVFCNRDYEPFAQQRDLAVNQVLVASGAAIHPYKDRVIFDQDEVPTRKRKPFGVFTPYKNAWLKTLNAFYLKPYSISNS